MSVAGSIRTSPSAAAFAAARTSSTASPLPEEARGARLDRFHEQAILVVRRHDHDLRGRRDLLDPAGGLDPRHPALEDDVHQHDVGQVLGGELDRRLGIVDGRRHELEIVVESDDGRERVRQDLVVVADQERGHGTPAIQPSTGSRTMSIVPPAGPSAIEASPPCSRAIGAADEESEPGSRAILVAGRAPVGEALEDGLALVRRDPRAAIDDLDQRRRRRLVGRRTAIGASGGENVAAFSISWRTTNAMWIASTGASTRSAASTSRG